MSNRILKESICSSETIDSISWFDEVFFYRLIVNSDDYGRMDARPAILKAKLFPLKDRLSLKDVEGALGRLADAGCVRLYECDSKPYLYLPTWEVHQRIRNHKSKYPEPTSDNSLSIDSKSRSIECLNPIQSKSEYESKSEYKHGAEDSAQLDDAAITLTLNDKSEYPIYCQQVSEWEDLYPAVDIVQELRKMKGWLDANPSRRKTSKGIMRFVANWLAKQQDSGRPKQFQQPNKSDNPFLRDDV